MIYYLVILNTYYHNCNYFIHYTQKLYFYLTGIEISQEGNEQYCRLTKADFINLKKQLNMDKNADLRQKLEDSNGLLDLSLAITHQDTGIEGTHKEKTKPSIQLLSRSTANAMGQMFEHKEKQAAW